MVKLETLALEMAGSYSSVTELRIAAVPVYRRHLQDISPDYGVPELVDILNEQGYITRESNILKIDGSSWKTRDKISNSPKSL